ncbi:TNR25 factor, partial [Xiphorhynchus elegans]|nr:TNR25 factor [Xiphorhynchus elegans]
AALLSPCLQVILAALVLAASESQPPGWRNRTVLQGQWVTRLRRHATRHRCPTGMNWIESARQCCDQCPAGTFLREPCTSHNSSVTGPCPTGTFRTQPNTLPKCQACYECDRQGELGSHRAVLCHTTWCCAAHCLLSAAFQSVLSNCSATSNIACGCEPGHFRVCLDKSCSDFSCQKCQPCTGRLIQRPCSETQDTLCDSNCKPDFYTEGDECRPCHTSTLDTCSKECQQACGSSSSSQGTGVMGLGPMVWGDCAGWLMRTLLLLLADSGLEYILLGLTGPLFLGALVIYHKRRRLRHSALAGGPLHTAQAATSMPGAVATPWYQFSARRWGSLCWPQPCPPQGTDSATAMLRQSPKHQALLREHPSGKGEPSAPLEPRSALLQGSQLYAVIDAVPVRRWKEFMRMLELREAEIELVELEVANIRDQQYEMLKRWCQQTSATLDRVFAALERMELAGCAEALRQNL